MGSAPHRCEELQPIHLRHIPVGENYVDRRDGARQGGDRLQAVARLQHLKSESHEDP